MRSKQKERNLIGEWARWLDCASIDVLIFLLLVVRADTRKIRIVTVRAAVRYEILNQEMTIAQEWKSDTPAENQLAFA